jgi:hypothetical protein
VDFNISFSDVGVVPTQAFDICGLAYTDPIYETESIEYEACYFTLNNRLIKSRTAKITPTKTGQFVTLWKRPNGGEIKPFDVSDGIDLVIINVRKGKQTGQFIFPNSALCKHRIFTFMGEEGKRGFRVYPPWDKTTNEQAAKTQSWQLQFFLDLSSSEKFDVTRAQLLYGDT